MFTRIDQTQLASGLNPVAGLWLVVSPFTLGYAREQTALANGVLVGVAIAVIGLIRAYGPYRATWLSLVNIALGLRLITAPWPLAYGSEVTRSTAPSTVSLSWL